MTPINWAMSPEVYEDMVSCLLSHLNRETRRIDGSGGDGGRDVQFELPDGSLSAQPVSCPSESPLEPVFAEFVGNLAMIQAATGIVREVPGDLEHTDLANAAAGAALVRGEEARQSWTELNLRLSEPLHGPQRRLAAEQPIYFKAELEGAQIVPVCGIEYPIGRKRQIEAVGRVKPALAQILLTDDETEVAELALHPEPNTHMKVRILSR